MACRESRGRKIVLCLTFLVVASSFCHCARLTKLKALDKLRGNSTLDTSKSEGIDVRHGRLLIGQNSLQGDKLRGSKATKNFLDVDTDHQKDMGLSEPMQLQERGDGFSRPNLKPESIAVDRLLKMDPKVECTRDSMTLQVQDSASSPGSLLFVDRGSRLSPLPLSKLPPSCGYSIRSTLRDLVLVAPYDGCFVALEEDCYVLLLHWLGLPVRMSCPLMRQSSPNPPMVSCHAQGMVVKTGWTVSIDKINVNLFGNWEPLMKASNRCGFSVVVHPKGVVISVRYAPCLEKKDGMYTLELAGEGDTQISCPSLSLAQTEHTWSTDGPKLQIETPRNGIYPSTLNPSQSIVPQVTTFIEEPSAKSPVTQQPTDQVKQLFPYPFYVKPPNPDSVPPAHTPELETPENLSPTILLPKKQDPLQPEANRGQVQQTIYPLPFYPQPEPKEQTAGPRTLRPEANRGQVQQTIYPSLFDPQPEPEIPTAAPRPPQPEVTRGQVRQPLYLSPFCPQPESKEPTAAQWPLQREATRGQVQQLIYPFPFYHQPEPEKPTAAPSPPHPEVTQGQVQQPLYPFLLYPQPEPKEPTAAPRPLQPEANQGQVQQPLYPFPLYHQPEPKEPTAAPRPLQPEANQGQVQQPLYPFLLYPQPEPKEPTAAPRPLQPEANQGQVQQPLYPFPLYHQPEPKEPTAAPRSLQPEANQGQVQQPLYPFPLYPQPEPEKPAAAPSSPQLEAPQVQVEQPFNPFPFHSLPKPGGIVPQDPPVYCPQICPSGFLYCCPQIAYHYHLHHIIPFGHGSRDSLSLYPGPPYVPSWAYSWFGNGLGSAPLPQEQTGAMTMQATITSTSAPISTLSLQSGNDWPQPPPPDGNLAALPETPGKPTNPEWPIYPSVPNHQYLTSPYLQQNEELLNLPPIVSPASYNVPSNPQAPGSEPGNPVLKYELYNVQPTKQQKVQLLGWDMNNPYGSDISQYLQQRVEKQQMLQDAQAQTYDKLTAPNMSQLQPLLSGSMKSTNHRPTVHSYSEPKSNVLLQHGPPGREPNGYNDSPLPFSDLVHDSSLIAQNLARHHSRKPQRLQNLKTPQEKPQHPKLLAKEMSNPFPVNDMPRPGDKLG